MCHQVITGCDSHGLTARDFVNDTFQTVSELEEVDEVRMQLQLVS